MNIKTTILTATTLCMIGNASAATIAYSGSVLNNSGNELTEWKTSGTAKTMDLDGDNVYGTFGGIAFGDAVDGAMGFVNSQSQVGPFAGYVTIDDINGGVDRQVVTTSSGPVAGTNVVMYTFQVNVAVAATDVMRVGLATDGLDGAQFTPASIGLIELGGGGGTAEQSITANAVVDMYFFDVTGGVASGTQFQVIADTGTGDYATLQFASLDVVPEPSSTALLGLGALALILRRRK